MAVTRRKVLTSVSSIKRNIPQITLMHVLTVLLIVAAYFIGALQTKVQYLEKNGGSMVANAQAAAQTTPAAGGAVASPAPSGPVVVNVANGHFPVRGQDSAKVTIVEFADFRCPFCKQTEDQVMPQIQKDYIDTGKVKLYFRHYAFLGPASTVAANAAECANDQGKFWDMHDYFYKNQPDESDTSMYTVDKLTDIAGTLGMDTAAFKDCLSANKFNSNVSKDFTEGQAAQVSATPTFYVNGLQLVGAQPYSAFQQAIEDALKKS